MDYGEVLGGFFTMDYGEVIGDFSARVSLKKNRIIFMI